MLTTKGHYLCTALFFFFVLILILSEDNKKNLVDPSRSFSNKNEQQDALSWTQLEGRIHGNAICIVALGHWRHFL